MTSTPTRPQRPGFFRAPSSSSSITKLHKDKPRLYIVLYPRGGSTTTFNNVNCDSYHWSIVISGQSSQRDNQGTRYHIAHDNNTFIYEEQDIPTSPTAQTALVRITVAKVSKPETATAILRSIRIPTAEEDSAFNCLTWTKKAYASLVDGKADCCTSYISAEDWPGIEACARKYVKRKRDQRRFTDPDGPWDPDRISTFNYWENRETTL